MRRNHKLESELAEKIVGYVLVNTDDYFAAEKQLELAQQTNNSAMVPLPHNETFIRKCNDLGVTDIGVATAIWLWLQHQ